MYGLVEIRANRRQPAQKGFDSRVENTYQRGTRVGAGSCAENPSVAKASEGFFYGVAGRNREKGRDTNVAYYRIYSKTTGVDSAFKYSGCFGCPSFVLPMHSTLAPASCKSAFTRFSRPPKPP